MARGRVVRREKQPISTVTLFSETQTLETDKGVFEVEYRIMQEQYEVIVVRKLLDRDPEPC